MGASPNVILTNSKSGITSIGDLIAKAKANPGKLNFGTPGVGSTPHMAMELLMASADIKLVHVPFSGLGPAVTAMLQGTTDITAVTVAGVMGYIKAGTVRALLQTGKEPWPELPECSDDRKSGHQGRRIRNRPDCAGAGRHARTDPRSPGERNRRHHEAAGRARSHVESRLPHGARRPRLSSRSIEVRVGVVAKGG